MAAAESSWPPDTKSIRTAQQQVAARRTGVPGVDGGSVRPTFGDRGLPGTWICLDTVILDMTTSIGEFWGMAKNVKPPKFKH